MRVIMRDGPHAATTRAVVAEAEMSLASFHYAFRSRDEMMRELIASVVADESVAALESIAASSDIRTSIRRGLQSYFDLLVADHRQEQVLLELMHYSLRTPDLTDLPRQQYAHYRSAVAAVLQSAASAAQVDWTIPVEDVARLIVTVTDGVTMAWLADRDDAAAARVLDFAADSLAALARPVNGEPR